MSIFSTTFDPQTGIKQDTTLIPLICFNCQKNFFTTTFKEFRCQNCETYYNIEQYQVRFMSLLSSIIFAGKSGAPQPNPLAQPVVTTNDKPVVENTQTIPRKPPVYVRPPITLDYFKHIYSFDDIKTIFIDAVNNPEPTHVCLLSEPGQGKTVFLKALQKYYGDKGKFINGQSLTSSGLTNYLLDNPDIDAVFIDEIDKSDEEDQMPLLGVMSDQQINELKFQRNRSAKLNVRVFASCNDYKKLYRALVDRFFFVYMPKYTKEQFYEIASLILANRYKDKYTPELQEYMLDTFYNSMKKVSMRDLVDKVAKLANPTKNSIDFYIKTLNKYTNENLI